MKFYSDDINSMVSKIIDNPFKMLNENNTNKIVDEYKSKNVINKSDIFGTSHKRDDDLVVQISSDDFSVLCVCALRYCQGRQTYMPSWIQRIVIDYIDAISNVDLNVMLEDEKMLEFTGYGDDIIDRPNWERFYHKLKEIKKERGAE